MGLGKKNNENRFDRTWIIFFSVFFAVFLMNMAFLWTFSKAVQNDQLSGIGEYIQSRSSDITLIISAWIIARFTMGSIFESMARDARFCLVDTSVKIETQKSDISEEDEKKLQLRRYLYGEAGMCAMAAVPSAMVCDVLVSTTVFEKLSALGFGMFSSFNYGIVMTSCLIMSFLCVFISVERAIARETGKITAAHSLIRRAKNYAVMVSCIVLFVNVVYSGYMVLTAGSGTLNVSSDSFINLENKETAIAFASFSFIIAASVFSCMMLGMLNFTTTCITDGIEENMIPGVTVAQFTERMIGKNVAYTMVYMFSGIMLSFAVKKYLTESFFAVDRSYAYYGFLIITAVLVMFIMGISLRYALVRFTQVSAGETAAK